MNKEKLGRIIELRHHLHQHAELSMQEKETSLILRTFLAENTRLEVIDRGSWFFAVKHGYSGNRRIAFRADMDALPIPEDGSLPYHSETAAFLTDAAMTGTQRYFAGLRWNWISRLYRIQSI